MSRVGIIMISTNEFLERWKICAASIEKFAFQLTRNVVLHLFTDKSSEALEWAKGNLCRIQLVCHEIDSWGWPEVTLYRYSFIKREEENLLEDFLMYLDSDMLLLRNLELNMLGNPIDDRVYVVRHPGFYFNFTNVCAILNRLNLSFLKFLALKIVRKANGFGSWEDNLLSTAYVPLRKRKFYVHGAIWMGKRKSILDMVSILQMNIESDQSINYIASWHDESHLNWFASNHPVNFLSPLYSGIPNYRHLSKLNPIIVTQEKSQGEGRNPTNLKREAN